MRAAKAWHTPSLSSIRGANYQRLRPSRVKQQKRPWLASRAVAVSTFLVPTRRLLLLSEQFLHLGFQILGVLLAGADAHHADVPLAVDQHRRRDAAHPVVL